MSRDDARPRLVVHVRPRMGTWLAVTLLGSPAACDRAARRAFEVAAALERQMSRFDPTSDLSRVGTGAGRFVAVPPDLAQALGLARRLARATDGAFDPTVGALTTLWRRSRGAPSRRALDEARRAVGWRRLEIRRRAVRVAHGMALDLDGFGKGWAADRIARALGRMPVRAGLVNFGESSLAVIGSLPHRPGWPVLVRDPAGGYVGWFPLAAGGCSTSTGLSAPGSAGPAPGVVDPRSGRRLDRRAQVTVVARSAAVAEAASTALLVAGRAAMGRLAVALGVQACWVDDDGVATAGGFRLRSPGRLPAA